MFLNPIYLPMTSRLWHTDYLFIYSMYLFGIPCANVFVGFAHGLSESRIAYDNPLFIGIVERDVLTDCNAYKFVLHIW